MHWHTADEWAYVLYGNARVTVMQPDGNQFIGDVSEGDLWIFPAGRPHSIQGLGPDGTEFLLVFNQGMFSEDGTMLLAETVAHMPLEVLSKNMHLDKSVFEQTPGAPLYIFSVSLPNSLEQDKEEIGDGPVAAKQQYTFHLKSMPPTSSSEAGIKLSTVADADDPVGQSRQSTPVSADSLPHPLDKTRLRPRHQVFRCPSMPRSSRSLPPPGRDSAQTTAIQSRS